MRHWGNETSDILNRETSFAASLFCSLRNVEQYRLPPSALRAATSLQDNVINLGDAPSQALRASSPPHGGEPGTGYVRRSGRLAPVRGRDAPKGRRGALFCSLDDIALQEGGLSCAVRRWDAIPGVRGLPDRLSTVSPRLTTEIYRFRHGKT